MQKKTAKSTAAAIEANKSYTLVSAQSGKAIEARANNALEMHDLNGAAAQLWRFVAVDDCYKLLSRTDEVIDVILAGTENGAQIHLWEDVGGENQLWMLEPVSGGAYKIKSKLSGKCLDVVGISGENGAKIQIWDDLDGENQKWLILDPDAPKPETAPAPEKKPRAPRKKAEPKSAKAAAPKAETKTEPKAAKAAAPRAKVKEEPKAAKAAGPKAEPKTAKAAAPKAEPAAAIKSEAAAETQLAPKAEPKAPAKVPKNRKKSDQ